MGRTPCCQIREGLKKGPWTPEEDQKLIAFINQHGLGNWRALPKKCGLLRCGKSCRLRWTNYLRPDIKRGRFSDSEDQKIIQLHALAGNRWAFIASQLPKRTDNEIKNYWNTVLKKRLQKMGHIFTETHQDHKPSETFSKSVSINVHTKLSMASSASSCRHLAQWENARLEAEARIARESKLRAGSSINCPSGFNFSSSANHPSNNRSSKQNNQYGLSYLSFNGHIQLNSIQDHLNHILLADCSTMSSSIFKNSPGSASTSCDRVDIGSSHKASLSSQDSITSALELGPRGRSISWKTQELSLLKCGDNSILNSLQYLSKPSSNNELDQAHVAKVDNSQPSCNNKLDQAHDAKVDNSQQPRGDIMVNLIDTSLPLEDSDLQDLLFEIENSCFDLVSTWRSEKDEPTLRANETATM